MILLGVVVAVSWWAVAAAAGGGCEGAAGGGSAAVLTAVMPLHSGTDCAGVNLRGLQQLAALRQAVASVNTDLKAQDGLSIGLRWEDSCQGAVSAALRLLVDSQQTCPQHPLHIGMVGPEEDGPLSRVLAVTGAFNVTHVLPRATPHHHTQAQHDAVLSVTVDRLAEQAQSVVAAVRAVGWRGFGLAFQEPQSALAEAVAKLANEDAALCVKGSLARITPSYALPLPTGSDGTVVLVESGEEAGRVLASAPASRPLLLLVRQVGLEAWQLPRNAPVFLMQQTSVTDAKIKEAMNATLKSQLAAQREARCEHSGQTTACQLQDPLSEVVDESVTALSDAVRLLAAALRTTCQGGGGCGRVSAAEWRSALRRVTATRGAPDTTRLRFNMDVPSAYGLYTRDSDTLLQVATVAGGVLKWTAAGLALPPPSLSADAGQCDGPPSPSLPAAAPSPTLKDLYTTDYAFYELVGMICGVGFIMFAVMVVIIYVIYNSLVEKGEKESTGGSVESRVGRRPAPPRRNLRDTFRRGSSVRSSTHS